MRDFNYRRADDLKTALAILAEEKENAYVVAGGTNVMPNIRSQKRSKGTLVDIRGIQELRGIEIKDELITVGPLTTISDLEYSQILEEYAPVLWQVAASFADPSTRHSATIGGNICNASPAADTAAPLLVLEATLTIESQKGSREISINDFFKAKGKTAVETGELLTKISFKKAPNSSFLKLGARKAMAISAANFAAALDLDGSKVKNVRIATGCLSPFPVRAFNAEQVVEGNELTQAVLDKMGEALNAKDIQPHSGLRASETYRRQVAPVFVGRTLKAAQGCGKGGAHNG